MKRLTSDQSGDRHANTVSRVTIEDTDDSKKWRELTLKGFHGESQDTIEHAEPYGFSSRVKKPDKDGKAEGIVSHHGGDRSHGVATVIGDRRYRPLNQQEGEVQVYDDQKQKMHFQRSGIRVDSLGKAHSVVVEDNAQHRVQMGGYVVAKAEKREKHKFFFGGKWWAIKESAFEPTDAPPDDPTK